MPVLVPGKAVRSRTPTMLVENPLEAGRWRFRLTVLDDDRNESGPAELIVTVRAGRTPPLSRASAWRWRCDPVAL